MSHIWVIDRPWLVRGVIGDARALSSNGSRPGERGADGERALCRLGDGRRRELGGERLVVVSGDRERLDREGRPGEAAVDDARPAGVLATIRSGAS